MELRKGFKKTDVGVIPSDWSVSTVGTEYEVCNNLRFPLSSATRSKMQGPYPYYGPTGIQDHLDHYRVNGEYALIGEDGDHFLKWQDKPMTLLVNGKFNVNNHAHLIQGEKNLTSWFYYSFYHKDLTQFLTRQGASRYKLTKASLLLIPCILPSTIKEQEAIANALSDADAYIESLEKLIAKKRLIKKGVMQELLTGKNRLNNNKQAWDTVNASVFGEIVTGGTPSTTRSEFWNGEFPWITPTDISNTRDIYSGERSITSLGRNELRPLPANALLVTCIASIGKNAILKVAGACNQQINAIIPNSQFDVVFLYYLFEFNKQFLLGNAGTTATAIISKQTLSSLKFKVPLIQEQREIAAVISDIDDDIVAHAMLLQKAHLLKKGMMQELLTGRIRLI